MVPPADAVDGMGECLIPQIHKAAELATEVVSNSGKNSLSFPLLNVGMPKSGSTTLQIGFECAGIESSLSWNVAMMIENGNMRSEHPLRETQRSEMQTCMQLDTNYDHCAYPRLNFWTNCIKSILTYCTFFMMRPAQEWIHSARTWTDLTIRWLDCKVPGLTCTGEKDSEDGPSAPMQTSSIRMQKSLPPVHY